MENSPLQFTYPLTYLENWQSDMCLAYLIVVLIVWGQLVYWYDSCPKWLQLVCTCGRLWIYKFCWQTYIKLNGIFTGISNKDNRQVNGSENLLCEADKWLGLRFPSCQSEKRNKLEMRSRDFLSGLCMAPTQSSSTSRTHHLWTFNSQSEIVMRLTFMYISCSGKVSMHYPKALHYKQKI